MKGKKFDAAEKHFEKKREQLSARIKSLEQQVESAHRDTRHFRSKSELLERENEELKKMVEYLTEKSGLTEEELKAACKKDAEIADTFRWLNMFGGMYR